AAAGADLLAQFTAMIAEVEERGVAVELLAHEQHGDARREQERGQREPQDLVGASRVPPPQQRAEALAEHAVADLVVVLREVDERRGRQVRAGRSEEHTSELQSRENLVCRLLLEKKKKTQVIT